MVRESELVSKIRMKCDNLERIASEGSRICAKLQDRAEKAEAGWVKDIEFWYSNIETIRGLVKEIGGNFYARQPDGSEPLIESDEWKALQTALYPYGEVS